MSIGTFVGKSGAVAKHAVLSTGLHTGVYAKSFVADVQTSYALKDQELAARRDALREAREAQPVTPVRRRQSKVATA